MLSRSIRLTILFAALGMAGAGNASAEDGDDDYPIEAINRPFTLPQGAVQAGFAIDTDKDFTAIGSALQVDYGLIHRLQVGAGYAMLLKDFNFKGAVFGEANFLFMTGGAIEGMATVSAGYSLLDEAVSPLSASALFWYTVNDMMAVYTTPTLSMALAEVADDAGNTVKPMYVSIPVSLAMQPIQTVFLDLGIELAAVEIADAPTQIIGRDYLSMYLEGYFSPSNKLDFGLGVSWDDLINDSGAMSLMAVVRARGGI